ncbi:MAG: cell division protein FtsQ, partial [Rhodospirillales bacterium]|nr:cell division protein FtsQ [Rhodospirillales bacterium]
APEHLGELLLLLQDAKPVRDRLRSAVYVGGRRWNLILDGGITLKLPADDAGAALARVVALDASDRLLSREVSVVDVRLPDLLVLRPSGAPDPIQSVGARAPARPEPQPAPGTAPGARPPAAARPPATGPNDNLRGKTGAPPAGQRI